MGVLTHDIMWEEEIVLIGRNLSLFRLTEDRKVFHPPIHWISNTSNLLRHLQITLDKYQNTPLVSALVLCFKIGPLSILVQHGLTICRVVL